jgi:hypothetical protein
MNHPIANPIMNSIIANAIVIPHSVTLTVVDTVVTRYDTESLGNYLRTSYDYPLSLGLKYS